MTFFMIKNLPKQQYRWLSFYPSTYPRYPPHPQFLSFCFVCAEQSSTVGAFLYDSTPFKKSGSLTEPGSSPAQPDCSARPRHLSICLPALRGLPWRSTNASFSHRCWGCNSGSHVSMCMHSKHLPTVPCSPTPRFSNLTMDLTLYIFFKNGYYTFISNLK